MRILTAFVAGLIFGLGLIVAQMVDPNKVLNFLDIAGDWDPSLAFVMGGAVIVTTVGYRLAKQMGKPVLESSFSMPSRKDIDGPLVIGAALFGAAWAAIPAYLQAKRGSHIVITTIMFNYIAAALLVYLLVDVLRPAGQMDPASARFPEGAKLPALNDIPGFDLIFAKPVPANVTLFIALFMAWVVWAVLWRTRLGYEIRSFGKSESAARYAGINPIRITMIAMLISGGLAGMMSINNVMGEAERLLQNSAEGAGFIGIAVALMGRNHPVGVVLAAFLFGFLYQGGAELGLWTSIPIEMRIVVQGLVILFTGALDYMVRMMLARVFALFRVPAEAKGAA